MSVRPASESDRDWVLAVWGPEGERLGNVGGSVWYRFWHADERSRERWLVLEPFGFVHYRTRRDGVNVVYEIAVAVGARRRGVARQLLEAVGKPIELKTDANNGVSLAAYAALGFVRLGESVARDGKRVLVHLGLY